MKTSPCRGCGKPIVWATNCQGKLIPLDPRAPVYSVESSIDQDPILVKRDMVAMVSHFATCPAANQFSGRNRGKPEGGA